MDLSMKALGSVLVPASLHLSPEGDCGDTAKFHPHRATCSRGLAPFYDPVCR